MPNSDSLTATLARFAGELTPSAIPASVKARIALHFIDSLGCGVAGCEDSVLRKSARVIRSQYATGKARYSTVELRSPPAAPRSSTPLR